MDKNSDTDTSDSINPDIAQDTPQDAPQDTSVGFVEVPQGPEDFGVPSDGPLPQAASEPAPMSLEKQNSAKKLKKSHKGLIITIIITLVLAVGVIAVWYFWGDRLFGAESSQEVENTEADEATEDEEKPDAEELVAVDVDSELVQKVYGNFAPTNRRHLAMNLWDVYINEDVRTGRISRDWMILLAKAYITMWRQDTGAYEYEECAVAYPNEVLSGVEVTVNGCLSGKILRDKVQEMFGEQVQFVEGESIVDAFSCFDLFYKGAGDEFVRFEAIEGGCGGMDPRRLIRVLQKAEEDAGHLYLYERILLDTIGILYHINKTEIDRGEMVLEFDMYNTTDEYLQQVTAEQGDTFLWTFRKTDDGNYVFESLKPVTE